MSGSFYVRGREVGKLSDSRDDRWKLNGAVGATEVFSTEEADGDGQILIGYLK